MGKEEHVRKSPRKTPYVRLAVSGPRAGDIIAPEGAGSQPPAKLDKSKLHNRGA